MKNQTERNMTGFNTLSGINVFQDEIRDSFILCLPDNSLLIKKIEVVTNEEILINPDILSNIIDKKLDMAGFVNIISCYSIPADVNLKSENAINDICIRKDKYHSPDYLINLIAIFLKNQEFNVSINLSDFEKILPEKYYQKDKRVNCVKIEFNNNFCMYDEVDVKINNMINDFFDNI